MRQEMRAEAPAGRDRPSAVRQPKGVQRPPRTAPMLGLRSLTLGKWIVWGLATYVFFYYTAVGVERLITWYLAVDQFGYLSFAHDLLHGRVFHQWAPLHALEPFFPLRTDVLSQTYVYDGGRLYCRYSPGFPILLAGWIGLLGDDRAHYLNPTLYLVLLAIALGFQWRMFRSPWRAGAGAAMIALFPTALHAWGLTLTRDMSAHVFALTGLFLLLPAHGTRLRAIRMLVAGAALGFAISIRPDAVLYLVSAALMIVVLWWQQRVSDPMRRAQAAVLALG